MGQGSTRRGGNLLRLILDVMIIVFFMNLADHAMRANLDQFWRYVPYFVNAGGALVGLAVVHLLRQMGLRWL